MQLCKLNKLKISGSVFLIPKLNPEYEDSKLLGPGVNAATNIKIINVVRFGYIVYLFLIQAISKPFSTF